MSSMTMKRPHDAAFATSEPPPKIRLDTGAGVATTPTSPFNAENRINAPNAADPHHHHQHHHEHPNDDITLDKTSATDAAGTTAHHGGRTPHSKNWHREQSLELIQLVDVLRPSGTLEWDDLAAIYNHNKNGDDVRTVVAVHAKWQQLAHNACLYPEGTTHMHIQDYEIVRGIVYDMHRVRELRHVDMLAEHSKEAAQMHDTVASLAHGPMYARVPAPALERGTSVQGMDRLAACLLAVKECIESRAAGANARDARSGAFLFDALSVTQLKKLAEVLEDWCAHPDKHNMHARSALSVTHATHAATSAATGAGDAGMPSSTSSLAAPAHGDATMAAATTFDVAASFFKSAQHQEQQHHAVLAALVRSLVVEQQRMTNEMWCAHRLAQAHHARTEAIAREQVALERERLALERERLDAERASFVALRESVATKEKQ